MSTTTPQQESESRERIKATGPSDAAWMIALLAVFAVAVAFFFIQIIQFRLLPH